MTIAILTRNDRKRWFRVMIICRDQTLRRCKNIFQLFSSQIIIKGWRWREHNSTYKRTREINKFTKSVVHVYSIYIGVKYYWINTRWYHTPWRYHIHIIIYDTMDLNRFGLRFIVVLWNSRRRRCSDQFVFF